MDTRNHRREQSDNVAALVLKFEEVLAKDLETFTGRSDAETACRIVLSMAEGAREEQLREGETYGQMLSRLLEEVLGLSFPGDADAIAIKLFGLILKFRFRAIYA